MDDIDTRAFLKEREDKLGAPILYKSYSLFFAQLGGEKRDHGVFLYSDGNTFTMEDFERTPTIMGIAYQPRKKVDYVKLEISWNIDEFESIDLVTRSSVDSSIKNMIDESKLASSFSKAFRKLITRIKLKDGRIFYLELLSHKDFEAFVNKHRVK